MSTMIEPTFHSELLQSESLSLSLPQGQTPFAVSSGQTEPEQRGWTQQEAIGFASGDLHLYPYVHSSDNNSEHP
jgi:hypothetical protein